MPKFSNKYTIISIIPWEMKEFKPGVCPQEYVIPESVNDEVVVFHVDEAVAYHHDYSTEKDIVIRMIQTSKTMANSIVNDFVGSMIEVDEDCAPGIMCVPGEYTQEEVKMVFSKEVANLRARQKRWYIALCQKADDDFGRTQRLTAVSDIQRIAARKLGLEVPWLIESKIKSSNCPACASQIRPEVAVCPNCKCIVDPEKAKKFTFAVGA